MEPAAGAAQARGGSAPWARPDEGRAPASYAPARSLALGAIHCGPDEAARLTRRLAQRAGLADGDVLEARAGGRCAYLAAGPTWTIQVERDDTEDAAGAGPFGAVPRWRGTLVLHPSDARSDGHDITRTLHALAGHLLPFSEAELACVRRLNPLVTALARRRGRCPALAAADLVLRDHMLLEKYNLLAGLRECGLDPARCSVIRKSDATRHGDRVAAQLRAEGFSVIDASEPLDGIADRVSSRAGRRPLVVVDDGGDLGIAIARRHRGELALIESTSKGVRTLGAAWPAGTFVDVAGSTVKLRLSRAIAVSCVMRLREILRHERLAGERCHVIGFGRLGRHVAPLLVQTGCEVTVSEIRPAAREDAHTDGFAVYASCRAALAAMPHRYLVGCSGVPVLGPSELALLAPDAVLASVSSQDLRPALDWLRAAATRQRVNSAGDRFVAADGRAWTVLGNGHAINLFLAEGVSEPEYDAFTALLLAAVVESAHGADVDLGRLCDEVTMLQADMRKAAVPG